MALSSGNHADYVEICQLIAKYCHAFDSGDCDAWAACFTDDGIFDGRNGLTAGRDELRKYAASARGRGTYRHLTGNILIEEMAGDNALVRSYSLYYELKDGIPQPRSSGKYEDLLVRVDGEWKIARRKFFPDSVTQRPVFPR
jgi:ketosteroid isomerase-like protein